MKKIGFILMIVFIILAIAVTIGYLYKMDGEELTDKDIFGKLIQYKVDSISEDNNIDKILKNTELSEYISRVDKGSKNGKEQLIIYYDCTIEADVKEYWRNSLKNSVTEKNSVILFSLIEKLDNVTYIFKVSDKELIEEYPYLSEKNTKEYNREGINLRYNQDVRNFAKNPDEFLKYNMNLNTNQITIYKMNYLSENFKYDKFEIREEQVNIIKDFIKKQNFGIDYEPIEGMIDIMVDFHNGYIIEIYANSNNAIISKGNAEDIINNVSDSNEHAYKTIPNGLIEYVNSLIKL